MSKIYFLNFFIVTDCVEGFSPRTLFVGFPYLPPDGGDPRKISQQVDIGKFVTCELWIVPLFEPNQVLWDWWRKRSLWLARHWVSYRIPSGVSVNWLWWKLFLWSRGQSSGLPRRSDKLSISNLELLVWLGGSVLFPAVFPPIQVVTSLQVYQGNRFCLNAEGCGSRSLFHWPVWVDTEIRLPCGTCWS